MSVTHFSRRAWTVEATLEEITVFEQPESRRPEKGTSLTKTLTKGRCAKLTPGWPLALKT